MAGEPERVARHHFAALGTIEVQRTVAGERARASRRRLPAARPGRGRPARGALERAAG